MKPFPKSSDEYLRAKDFHDNQTVLTFLDWDRKANEDDPAEAKNKRSWKDKLKYCLPYTYPQMAMDPVTGEKRIGKDGRPFQNKYWEADFPHGWTPVYKFEEGILETGSLPLWRAFCRLNPAPYQKIEICRTGQDQKKMSWSVRRVEDAASGPKPKVIGDISGQITDEELVPDNEVPF